MIHLRKILKELLKTYQSDVFFHKSSKDTLFPYIVFDLPNSFKNEDQEIFNFEVDIWDKGDDTTKIETIANDIWKGLNHYFYLDDYMQITIYQANRLPPLDEEETNIKRRKLMFELKYFDRED